MSSRNGVGQRPWLQAGKYFRLAGWTIRSWRSQGTWSRISRNTRDPTVFAAASDTAVGRVVECKAVLQDYSMFTFDVTSAYTHAWEDELVFLEPPAEEIEEQGDCLWISVRVIYGRHKGARSWQKHLAAIIRSPEARQRGFTVDAHPKCPTMYHIPDRRLD